MPIQLVNLTLETVEKTNKRIRLIIVAEEKIIFYATNWHTTNCNEANQFVKNDLREGYILLLTCLHALLVPFILILSKRLFTQVIQQ